MILLFLLSERRIRRNWREGRVHVQHSWELDIISFFHFLGGYRVVIVVVVVVVGIRNKETLKTGFSACSSTMILLGGIDRGC